MTAPTVDGAGLAFFDGIVASLRPLLDQLLSVDAVLTGLAPAVPGIYLFSEGERAIYVGQTRDLKRRLDDHSNPLSRENKASLAFNVAKAEAEVAGLNLGQTRKALEADPAFIEHFAAAKERVGEMEVRIIELKEPYQRTIFELYASLALNTLVFNKFQTH